MGKPKVVIKIGTKRIKVGKDIKKSKKQLQKEEMERLENLILEIGKNPEKSQGMMDVAQIFLEANKLKKVQSDEYTIDEIKQAIKNLDKQNLVTIKRLKGNIEVVEFVPVELSGVQNKIIEIAAEKGWVSIEDVILNCNLNAEIAEKEMKKLEDKKIAIKVSDRKLGKRWYFRGFAVDED
ncbi:MAG: hypothetical protein EAX96_12270 [Candidatus Lokiarchaeota archaeon]|nr:hypothetical protein [Candidatus Lokiarchaeota archaeon]